MSWIPRRAYAFPLWLALVAGWLLVAPVATAAEPATEKDHRIVIQPGEYLQYAVFLLGIPAGTATFHVLPSSHDRPTYRIVSTAQSNAFVSLFFPVRNVVDSTVDAETWRPLHLVFQRREGKRHEDFDVTFHHATQSVTVIKDGQVSTHSIAPGTYGPLSCLYYLRSLPALQPGTSVFITIHHDRKNYRVEVRVEARERLAGPWGEVETIRVLAVMPFQG
ncbi:MAG: DUF3108 domain-containing protein, partial [Nitrospirae bacterium]